MPTVYSLVASVIRWIVSGLPITTVYLQGELSGCFSGSVLLLISLILVPDRRSGTNSCKIASARSEFYAVYICHLSILHVWQSSLYILCCFFLSLMLQKTYPLFYIYPTKTLFLMIKYELSTSCRWCWQTGQVVQLLGSAKNWPTHERCYASLWKIPSINVVQPFYGCLRNAHKNITVTVC